MHRHKSIRESGPQCCRGSVFFVDTCSCGAKRRTCNCHQCRDQGTNDSGWYMPQCDMCQLSHGDTTTCESAAELVLAAQRVRRQRYPHEL